MFTQTPQQVVVLTDTLATTQSGSPLLFVTKCTVVPDLEMVVAHTGVAQVGHRWSHRLQTAMLARDIDQLDSHVPPALRSIAAEVAGEFGDHGTTSTVYHLGFSEARQAYRRGSSRTSSSPVSSPPSETAGSCRPYSPRSPS
jgi:hypothetical protein